MAEGRILESWKEIAEYLRRTPKTCQRWEHDLDLPIHRLDGSPKASVFAYQEELDRWLNEKLHEKELAEDKSSRAGQRKRRFFYVALPLVLVLAATAAVIGILTQRAPRPSGDEGRPAAASAPALPSIAVLPFENLTHDPAHDYFVEGIHDGADYRSLRSWGRSRSRHAALSYDTRANNKISSRPPGNLVSKPWSRGRSCARATASA